MPYQISSLQQYKQEYAAALANHDEFWDKQAQNFHWFKKWDKVSDVDFNNAKINWFVNGKTNIAYNCLEKNLENGLQDKVAIIFEPNDPNAESQKITYQELHDKTCQFANLLLAQGIKAGDRVCIYMPMIPESAIAMLACARIGAVHSVVFAGFSAHALAGRIQDSGAKFLITADLLFRGDKIVELFAIAKEALQSCNSVERVLIYKRDKNFSAQEIHNKKISDDSSHKNKNISCYENFPKILIWQDEIKKYSSENEIYYADSEDPLFILYTSGSTGKPKGIVHTQGGYMVYAAYSFANVFQYKPQDIFFCTADIGWITGHSYLLYAPLLNGGTSLMFEGVPTYPTPSRFWQIIEKYQVNIFYTAPTAIRALMQKGDEFVVNYNLQSLKTLGSVGEPINAEAWQWYYEKVGRNMSTIIDSWWQTETGGILISALSKITESRATYAGTPLPGIEPILLDDDGVEIKEANKTGNLCFKKPWPSMLRGVWGDNKKFHETYFSRFKGYYFSGDGAFKSEDGMFRIIGRVDDVLNVSGHRIGTAEIENVVNQHANISESATIGYPHQIKGEGICVFAIAKVFPQDSSQKSTQENEIVELVKTEIGAIAKPDKIYIVADLPKTRSGKIMRRILKKIIAKEKDLGDVSTLVNPDVVAVLQKIVG